MTLVRRLLFRGLGTKRYLLLISRVYLWGVSHGLGRQQYPELFFLEKLVRPGACCLDIGANLGYYTLMLSRLCGSQGRVLAAEPVPLFTDVLRANLQAFGAENVTVLPFALGGSEEFVQMGTPEVRGVFRHGCTRVLTALDKSQGDFAAVYEVEMRRSDDLFRDLERLDFIKCDAEGYETEIFRHLADTLRRHRPVVQVEINTEANREIMLQLLRPLGYVPYTLRGDRLVSLDEEKMDGVAQSDYYFLP